MVFSAEPNDPAQFNKVTIDKLREDLKSRPIIARKLSQSKGAREFLEQNSQANTDSNALPEAPAVPIPHQPPHDTSGNTAPQQNPSENPENNSKTALPEEPSVNKLPDAALKEVLDNARRKAEEAKNKALKKALSRPKIDYKHKTFIFYRKECELQKNCIKVPVMTNLKSVIFEYNQGRYSAHSVKFSPRSE